MGKDPAFLFYPNDYIGGTMGMTFEEKGAYMELLMMQFNRGHMTTHMIGQTVGQLWDKIEVKFAQDDKGLWYNVRLEEEQIKRQEFTKSRRNNVLGTNQHSSKPPKEGGHMTTHMENVNKDEIVIKKGKCLMRNSGLSVSDVKEAFLKADDLKAADPNYYFNAVMDWSDGGSIMRIDWIATARSFARKDIKDGKLKLSIHKQQRGTNMGDPYNPEPLPETWAAIPDSLKKHMSKIGKA